ncbi:hypothetical protein Q8F55_001641 [Vanrija albida]|uniref:Integral membrane protein n=1 Tax=Vanrija albida TaxID=181172 RepID=A0ABR3Q7J3_9TREE
MSGYGYGQAYNPHAGGYAYTPQTAAPPQPGPPPLPPRPVGPPRDLADQFGSLGISPAPHQHDGQQQQQQYASAPPQQPQQQAYAQQHYQQPYGQQYAAPLPPPLPARHPPAAYGSYAPSQSAHVAPPPLPPRAPQPAGPAAQTYAYSQPAAPAQHAPAQQFLAPSAPAPAQPQQQHYAAQPYAPPAQQFLAPTGSYPAPAAQQARPAAQHQPTQFLAPIPQRLASPQDNAYLQNYQAPATPAPYHAPSPAPSAHPAPGPSYQAVPAATQAPSTPYQAPTTGYQAQSPPSQPYASPPAAQPYASPPAQQYASPPAHYQSPPAATQQSPLPPASNPYAANFPPGWTFSPPPPAQSHPAAAPVAAQPQAASTAAPATIHNLEDDPLPPMPVIRPEGAPPAVLPRCSGGRALLFDATVYYLQAYPDFVMCTFCHAKYVANTPLASAFLSTTKYEGGCDFGLSLRLRKILLPKQDIAAITDYLAVRTRVPVCPAGYKQKEGTEYWASPELSDINVCDGCYHDWLGATPWQDKFTKKSGGEWYCDGAMGLAQRALVRYGSRGDWSGFVTYLNTHQLAVCEGKPVPARSAKWYAPRRPIPGMVLCQSCFNESIAGTAFESEFVPYECSVTDSNDFTCDFHHASVVHSVFMAVEYTGNYDTFWNTAAVHLAVMAGQRAQAFYTFAGPPSNFDVCETCLMGYIVPLGMQQYFVRQTNEAGCDMCPSAPRRETFYKRLTDAFFQTNFRAFAAFARKISQYPACPSNRMRKNGTWYVLGPAANVCAECWVGWGAATPQGRKLNLQPTQIAGSLICCLWSVRMRRLWVNDTLPGFLEFAAHRQLVYTKTWMKMENDLLQNVVKAAQAGNMAVNGIAMAGAYADPTNTVYGNSSIGWHDSSTQATGHQMIQQSNKMWQEVAAGGGNDHAALLRMWLEVV